MACVQATFGPVPLWSHVFGGGQMYCFYYTCRSPRSSNAGRSLPRSSIHPRLFLVFLHVAADGSGTLGRWHPPARFVYTLSHSPTGHVLHEAGTTAILAAFFSSFSALLSLFPCPTLYSPYPMTIKATPNTVAPAGPVLGTRLAYLMDGNPPGGGPSCFTGSSFTDLDTRARFQEPRPVRPLASAPFPRLPSFP
eukprot:scaffold1401_cov330-Pavlova_lutheri.AAC.79